MKIIIKGNGLHGSETKAVSRMSTELRDTWHAYASVLICDSQGSMEFDLIVVTHDRILVVELKNWRGNLTSYDGNWYIDGKYRSKSPYHTKRDQAIRLSSILKTELQHKLGYYPFVEAHVVLCGAATPENLPASEKLYVHTLDEFLKIRDSTPYNALVQSSQMIKFDEVNRQRPNSHKNLQIFDGFFRGQRVKLAKFKINGYEAADTPDHQHDHKLFLEYPATHDTSRVLRAMIRRWDLEVLGIINREDSVWQKVVSREDHLYRTASATNSPLQHFMLRPLVSPDEDNISADCVAMYEVKKNMPRLSDYINLNAHKWNPEQKLDIVRALLIPFAELHSMGAAHRDIQPQNLWYSEDSAYIVTSGFHAAFLPEKGTVKGLNNLLKSSITLTPEDVYGDDGVISNPFAQDVYLLGIVAHKICFPGQKIVEEEGVSIWKPIESDPFAGKLNGFFEKAMDLEYQNRFVNAAEMLAEFNAISLGSDHALDDATEVRQALIEGDFIKKELSPYSLYTHFPPLQGVSPPVSGEKISYRCQLYDKQGWLKFWPKVGVDIKNPGVNRRLLRMRRRIEKAVETNLPISGVIQYGLFGEGQGLFIVTRHEEGITWRNHVQTLVAPEQKLLCAIKLCDLIIQIHSSDFAHGDLHPDNILVDSKDREGEVITEIILIDALDYGDTSDPYNVEYGPANPAVTDAYGRDKFAVYKMVKELFLEATPKGLEVELQAAAAQPDGVPVDISLLRDCIQKELEQIAVPPTEAQSVLRLVHHSQSLPEKAIQLQKDGAEYYLEAKISTKNKNEIFCVITAHEKKLTVCLNPINRMITAAWVKESGLGDYASAAQHAQCCLTIPITVERGIISTDEPNSFIEFIMGQEVIFDLLAEISEPKNINPINDVPPFESIEQTIKPFQIWQMLMDTEEEQRQKLEIFNVADIKESKSGAWLINCVLRIGNELEFSFEEGEEIGVYLSGEERPFGYVIQEESGDETLAVKPNGESLPAFKRRVGDGMELFLESKRNHASRFRRRKAMDRVLSGNSRIHSLQEYFDELAVVRASVSLAIPEEAVIRARYDHRNGSDEELNPKQIMAFQKVLSQAPISVLQGPPGTGKTAFISKLIHYLFENGLAGNILLVGQSHTSVDTVAIKAKELCEELGTKISLVRLGQEHLIDEKLLQCHPGSIQRKMRHKFQREYEIRINSLASRLMLDKEFVEEVAKLHRSISPLLARIALLLSRIKDLSDGRELGVERQGQIEEHKRSLEDCIDFVRRNIETRGYEFILPEVTDAGYWEALSNQIALRHGISNQIALRRLNQLISISKDWVDVLASGSSSFDRFFVQSSQLVAGTLVGMGANWLNLEEQEFDWVIVDEAGRAQASELMIPLQCAKRLLLVGDHCQLPPNYELSHVRHVARKLQITEAEVRKTDFERAFIANEGLTLDLQYRMIEPIGDIISNCFYKGQLQSYRKIAPQWCEDFPYPLNKPVTWIDSGIGDLATPEESLGNGKLINRHESAICMHMLRLMARSGSLKHLRAQKSAKNPFPIGIIVMYRAQKQLLEGELSRAEWAASIRDLIKIETVDAYQGQENSIIILSLVRNNPEGKQGFLVEPPRINVALSRAQERLVVIGSKHMWERSNQNSHLSDVLGFISAQKAAGNESYEFVDGTTVIEGTAK